MEASLEQRYVIKFCVRLQKSASETFDIISEIFNDEATSRASIFCWHKAFKEGRQNVEEIEREAKPSKSIAETMINTAAIIIKENHRITEQNYCILS